MLDTARLQQFGTLVLYPDIGPASGCTAEIEVGGGSLVDIELTLATPTKFESTGESMTVGDLTVIRRVWATSYGCGHTIETEDGSQVIVTARASLSATTNICSFADAGVDGAVPKLAAGRVGKRPVVVPPSSLLGVDACGLVKPGDDIVPNLDLARVEPGYGEWSCTFGDSRTDAAWVFLEVQFSGARDDVATRTIAGRMVIPFDDELGSTCSMRVVQRDYVTAEGWKRTESLMVRVYAGSGIDHATSCRGTTALIELLAQRMPRPS